MAVMGIFQFFTKLLPNWWNPFLSLIVGFLLLLGTFVWTRWERRHCKQILRDTQTLTPKSIDAPVTPNADTDDAKLNIQIVENPISERALISTTILDEVPTTRVNARCCEFYFRVTNIGKCEARLCTARLELAISGYAVTVSPNVLPNPKLDWFQPDIRYLGTSAIHVKKLGKTVNLPPDPEKPLYAGIIQIYRNDDGSGHFQMALTNEREGTFGQSFSISKIYKLSAIFNYVGGKGLVKSQSRSYILNLNSFANLSFKEYLM